MWVGILVVLVIVILVILLVMVVLLSCNNCSNNNNPCTSEWKNPCSSDLVIIYNGSNLKLKSCDNHGRIGNTEYMVVHKDVKTYIPFRPTKIEGNYSHVIFLPTDDEVDHIHIHKKTDGDRIKGKPNTWNSCYVMVH